MPTKYQTLYLQALAAYKAQSPRFGYPRGYFSWARHWSLKETAEMQTLKEALSGDDEAAAKEALEAFLPGKNQDNHSFATYLLDNLEKACPDEGWGEHRLASKKIVFYTGEVWRGLTSDAHEVFIDDVFNNGLKEYGSPSASVSEYTSDTSMHRGISTSTRRDVAMEYAVPRPIPTARGAIYRPTTCLLVQINYRGATGVDIVSTLEARENTKTLSLTQVRRKAEVNIIGSIPKEDIVAIIINPNGRKPIRRENPHYKKDRVSDLETAGTAERLVRAMKAPGS